MKQLQKQINKIFFLLYFFLMPAKYSSYIMLVFIIVSLIMIFFSFLHKRNSRIEITFFIRIIILIIIIIIGLLVSTYSMINTIQCFLFLLIIYFSYFSLNNIPSINNRKKIRNKFDWFYYIGIISIVIHLCLQIFQNGIELNRFYIPCGAWDINVGALALFSFYCYCDSKKHKLWIPLIILTTYFGRDSRGSVLIVILFFIVKFIKYLQYKFFPCKPIKPGTTRKTFLIIIFATVITILFSFVWTFTISFGGVASYHQGLNDDSNAVRFRANVYAVQQVFGSPNFIFFGYDDDIRSALGDIDNVNHYRTFMGYRLVQSHNSILNMFMKNGIIFAIIYILLLSRVLKKYFDKEHIEYWLPYLFGSMLVHGMFITSYLVAFMVALDAKSNIVTEDMMQNNWEDELEKK